VNDVDEGDVCPDCGKGRMGIAFVGSCTCHLGHPPCWRCENSFLECDECGWRPEDEDKLREILDDGVKFWKDMGDKWSDTSFLDVFELED
jgi:hypothetical protein